MSRFSNLEFGDSEESRAPSTTHLGPAGATRDEHFFVAAAQRAFARGEFEPGLRLYARALEHNPRNIAAWTGQVRMLIELGEVREARIWADKALEQFPREPELLAAKAVALARGGDLEGAMAFSDAALEERGETPYVWLARGDVLLARHDTLADHCLNKALLLARGDWFVAWLAARVRRHYRQFAAALRHVRDGLALDATQFVLWLEQADLQLALGLRGPALASYRHAAELEPSCDAARVGALAAERLGWRAHLQGLWRAIFQ